MLKQSQSFQMDTALLMLIWLLHLMLSSFCAALSKNDFCRAYSQCRQQAQSELAQCAGGTLSALAASKGMLADQGEMASSQKCIFEMNKTIGNSMRALYERLERKALKCADQKAAADPRRELNQEEVRICKSIHLDFLSNYSSPFALFPPTRGEQLEDPSVPQECVQLHDPQLLRCQRLNRCCPELDSCIQSIEAESQIRSKEQRVLKLLDKCINEVPVKSAEVVFVKMPKKERVDSQNGMESDNVHTQTAAADLTGQNGWESPVDPVPIPILASSFPSSSSPPTAEGNDSSTTPSIDTASAFPTLIPPPDPTVRDLFALLFPGLDINGGGGGHRKKALSDSGADNNEMALINSRRNGIGLPTGIDFAMDRQRNVVTASSSLVDNLMMMMANKKGKKKKPTPMELIVEGEDQQSDDGRMGGRKSFDQHRETPSAFVTEANAIVGDPAQPNDEAVVAENQSAFLTESSSKTNTTTTTPTPPMAGPTTPAIPSVNPAVQPISPKDPDRLATMAVGRIFCQLYEECLEASAKMVANCQQQAQDTGQNQQEAAAIQLVTASWFTIERLTKCLEARPLRLLANALLSDESGGGHCPVVEELQRNCRILRKCCPSIV